MLTENYCYFWSHFSVLCNSCVEKVMEVGNGKGASIHSSIDDLYTACYCGTCPVAHGSVANQRRSKLGIAVAAGFPMAYKKCQIGAKTRSCWRSRITQSTHPTILRSLTVVLSSPTASIVILLHFCHREHLPQSLKHTVTVSSKHNGRC